jgi:hypothetical protein
MKFQRRPDLSAELRINITLQAILSAGVYGARTRLAKQHSISRTTLYNWLFVVTLALEQLFATDEVSASSYPLTRDEAMLLLRLESNASIQSISDILTALGYSHVATGTMSTRLNKLGAAIADTLKPEKPLLLFWLSDELFANGYPILITMEPVSAAILRIELANDRKAVTWENHFRQIEANQIDSSGLCSDRGSGIVGGYSTFNRDLTWCSDHFHEFRSLQSLLSRVERKAYAAIEHEQEREQVFLNRRSEAALEKHLAQLEKAEADCVAAIERYDHLHSCLAMLFSSLYFFDLSSGKPRFAQPVKEELSILLDLLDECDLTTLRKETATVRSHLDEICACYQPLESLWSQLSSTIPENTLHYLALAWQHEHQSHQHKGKAAQIHRSESRFWLEAAEALLPEDKAQTLIEQVFDAFNGLVRSSSLVEMVNSSLRPFLNACRGNVTQEQLNLFMFYFNHHRFHSGKRKERSPIGILTGTEPDKPWWKLLLETAEPHQED